MQLSAIFTNAKYDNTMCLPYTLTFYSTQLIFKLLGQKYMFCIHESVCNNAHTAGDRDSTPVIHSVIFVSKREYKYV